MASIRLESRPTGSPKTRGSGIATTCADDTKEFIVVDTDKGTRQPAFDHAKLAAALVRRNGKERARHRGRHGCPLTGSGSSMRAAVCASPSTVLCGLVTWRTTSARRPRARTTRWSPPTTGSSGATGQGRTGFGRAGSPATADLRPMASGPPSCKAATCLCDRGRKAKKARKSSSARMAQPRQAMECSNGRPTHAALAAFRIEPGERKEVFLVESSPRGGRPGRSASPPLCLARRQVHAPTS